MLACADQRIVFVLVIGKITLMFWTRAMEEVLQMKLPWYLLRPKLVVQDSEGYILYNTLFEGYKIDSSMPQVFYTFLPHGMYFFMNNTPSSKSCYRFNCG